MKRKIFEKIDDSCGDVSLDAGDQESESILSKLEAKEYDSSSEHPTPEQLLVREAVKFLTPKQKKVWELYNYDRLTQDEIAKKLGVRQQTIQESIKGIEHRIAKWVKSNMGAYNLLKKEYSEDK